VITGVGLTTPLGETLDEVSAALRGQESGVQPMPEWARMASMHTTLGAPVRHPLRKFPRKITRTMGRVAQLAYQATLDAVEDAGLTKEQLESVRTGVSYGSTHGSTDALEAFCMRVIATQDFGGLKASDFLKFMSHTAAANLATVFGVRGRVHTTTSACTSGSQGIGYGYEAIAYGHADRMLCGGAEELHVLHAGVFDIMYATSTSFADDPSSAPRPFDAKRDGLVIGEGAASFVLEARDQALARGAHIYAEILGYGTTCDGTHMTAPSQDGMASAMELALQQAGLAPDQVDYINAHGTATKRGDAAESHATLAVYGPNTPVSSTKGLTGHTLGAAGAVETAFCLAMLRDGFLAPNANLGEVADDCAQLNYVREPVMTKPRVIANHNFAFAGINTALLLADPSWDRTA